MDATATTTPRRTPDPAMRARALANRRARAAAFYAPLLPTIRRRRHEGATLNQIAWELNRDGFRTCRGKPWSTAGLHQVLGRHPETPGSAPPPAPDPGPNPRPLPFPG